MYSAVHLLMYWYGIIEMDNVNGALYIKHAHVWLATTLKIKGDKNSDW